jgi:hypothetical protein
VVCSVFAPYLFRIPSVSDPYLLATEEIRGRWRRSRGRMGLKDRNTSKHQVKESIAKLFMQVDKYQYYQQVKQRIAQVIHRKLDNNYL